jgi:hypothetical protein
MLQAAALFLTTSFLLAGQPQVWFFVRTDCPLSNRYAPAIERAYQTYSKQNVRFLLVYTEPGATKDLIEKHRQEYKLTAPFEIDAHHAKVKQAQVKFTPEVAVFSPKGELAYHGRIDDQHAFLGAPRRPPRHNYLEEALQAVLAGRMPQRRLTLGHGCAIERPDIAK